MTSRSAAAPTALANTLNFVGIPALILPRPCPEALAKFPFNIMAVNGLPSEIIYQFKLMNRIIRIIGYTLIVNANYIYFKNY